MNTKCLPVPEHATRVLPLEKKRFSRHSLIVSLAVTAAARFLRAVTENAAFCDGAMIVRRIRDKSQFKKNVLKIGKKE